MDMKSNCELSIINDELEGKSNSAFSTHNSSFKRLGDYIQLVDERNRNLKVSTLLGLTVNKEFIPSVANTVGTNMANYKIIRKNQFACSLMQVRRDKKIPVAVLKELDEAIISQAYPIFEIINEDKILPDYLMMWFSRSEFDREACFYAVGGVRGSLEWEDFCNMQLPVPSLEKQKEIVAEYNTIVNRIKLNEELNKKLEETAQAIYKQWFVDFEFLCLPSDYSPARFAKAGRPHGQINPNLTESELISQINSVSTYRRVGGLPVPDGSSWFVYIIECLPSSKDEQVTFYKGITNDLYRRFYEHFIGQGAEWTKVHKPLRVIHWEQFNTQEEAAKREKDLKTGYGRTWIQREYEKLIKAKDNGLPAPESKLRKAGKMVWNEELGKEIPEGWRSGRLGDIANYLNGLAMQKFEPVNEEFIPVIKIKELNQGFTDRNSGKARTDIPNEYIIKNGDIIFSWSGTLTIDIWCGGKGGLNQHLFKVTSSKYDKWFYYLWTKNYLGEFNKIADGKKTSMGHIKREDLKNAKVIIPIYSHLNSMNVFFKPIIKTIIVTKIEKFKLFDLKETLVSKMAKG